MPQLDVSTYSSQLFWLFVCFSAMYLYVAMVTVPRIEALLELRWQNVEGNQLKAQEFKKDIENLEQEYEEALAEAKRQANKSMMASLQKISLETASRKKVIIDDVMSRIKSAEQEIDKTQELTQKDMRTAAHDVTHIIIDRLLSEKASESLVSDAVDNSFRERGL